jgi:hypothetical protein
MPIDYNKCNKKREQSMLPLAQLLEGQSNTNQLINAGLLLELGQLFHQAALTPGSVILMNDALLCSPVQGADRLRHRNARLFGTALADRSTSFSHISASAASINTIVNSAFLVLPVAFYLRLDVRQNILQKYPTFRIREAEFYLRVSILSSTFSKEDSINFY